MADTASDRFEQANAALEDAEERIRQCQTELDPLNERRRELKDQFDTNKTALIKATASHFSQQVWCILTELDR